MVMLVVLVTVCVCWRHTSPCKKKTDAAARDAPVVADDNHYWRTDGDLERHTSSQTSACDYVNKKTSNKTNVVSCSLLVDTFDRV